MSRLYFPIEIKFAANGPDVGSFEGYASVYGVVDGGGDMVAPGAFDRSLAEITAQKRQLPMYMMHGAVLGADPRPVGVWDNLASDDKGLKVAGHLIGLDTETGRYNHALVKDGAMRGISIGYKIPTGGVQYGSKVGEPRRTLKHINLREISIVDDPMNAQAVMTSVKAATAEEIDAINSLSDAEDFLREADRPWTKKSATDFVGRLVKIARREAGDDQGVSGLLDQLRLLRKQIVPTS